MGKAPSGGGCGVFCHVSHAIGGLVGGVVHHAVSASISAVLDGVAAWVADAAAWVLARFLDTLTFTSKVDLSASWFTRNEGAMAALAAVVAVPMLVGALVQAVVRQSPELALRAAFVHLPLALVLTGVAVQLVAVGLSITDQLSAGVMSGAGGSLEGGIRHLVVVVGASGQAGAPSFVVVVAGLLLLVGSVALWLELVVRAAAIYAAVLFLPLALASLVWPSVSYVARRLVATIVGLVLSKFVIVSILALGWGAVAAGTASPGGVPALFAGSALLLLAAFSPFSLLRLVAVADGALAAEGLAARVQAAATMVPRSAARVALRATASLPFSDMTAGTGGAEAQAGSKVNDARRRRGATPERGGDPPADGDGSSVGAWPGTAASQRAFDETLLGAEGAPGPGGRSRREPGRPGLEEKAAPEGSGFGASVLIGGDPLWGQATTSADATPHDTAPGTSLRHRLGHDDLGPVIEARPPGPEKGHPEDAGA